MKITIFETGKPQTLEAILANKDRRATLQNQLLKQFPSKTLLTIKLNTPGTIKNNEKIKHIFTTGITQLRHYFPVVENEWSFDQLVTGPEVFWIINLSAIESKQRSVAFEENFQLGRLFDVDVLSKGKIISRNDLNLPSRKCLICSDYAKSCARSQRHSILQLQFKISKMYQNYYKHEN